MTITRLGGIRRERGIAAAELARLVGVSRQTIYAIEDGTYTPNTAVALALAQVLAVRVEDLFSLEQPLPPATATEQPVAVLQQAGEPATAMVRTHRVGEHLVAVPAPGFPYFLPWRDGEIAATTKERLLIAGCDPALTLLTERLNRVSAVEVIAVPASSRQALAWLHAGWVHMAGTHLLNTETGEWNAVDEDLAAITFAHWEQGFGYRKGALPVRRFADLSNRKIRFINRETGAGSREILDGGLAADGLDGGQVRGYGNEGHGHLAVAYAVAGGQADCCVTNAAAARFYGLEFTPLRTERFDLILQRETLNVPDVTILLEQLAEGSFRQRMAAIGGYGTAETGRVKKRG